MTRRALGYLAAIAGLVLIAPAGAGAAIDDSRPLGRGVIVQYAPDADRADRVAARVDADVTYMRTLGDSSFQLVDVEPGQAVREAVSALRDDPAVVAADANGHSVLHAVPNDARFGELWGLRNLGGSTGIDGFLNPVAGADIAAPAAWDVTVGSPSVVVAVIDSGYRFDHPDLAAVATADGRDFIGPDADADPLPTDSDPTDDDSYSGGHGTHVAGTIGAAGNNGIGVTGVGWNLSVMPLRVCSYSVVSQGVICPYDAQIEAINYAGAHGARVANMSLGGASFQQTVVNAIAANPNVLFVVSAGNDEQDNDVDPSYPCAYEPTQDAVPAGSVDNVVCVAATDQADELADFSNWGEQTVDLAAPGTKTLSTYPLYTYGSTTPIDEDFDTTAFDTTWSDSGAGGGFDRSGEDAGDADFEITDSPGATPVASQERASTSNAVELPAGYGSCTLRHWRRLNLTGGATFGYSILIDGATVDSLTASATGPGTFTRTIRGPAVEAGGDVQVRFRFTAGASPTAATGAWVDDVEMDCFDASAPQLGYRFINGTSMASPHVAGTAGLLFSRNPAIGVAQARTALLQGVDAVPGLSGLTATGGRLDAARALSLIPAPTVTISSDPPVPPPPLATRRCKVPKLKGLSQSKAKTALVKAGCKLGKVTKPKKKKGQRKLPALIVKSSKPKAGAELAVGAKVAVKLGPKPKPKKRKRR